MASRAIWLLLGLAAAKPKGVRLRARVSEIHVAGKLALGAEVGRSPHLFAWRSRVPDAGEGLFHPAAASKRLLCLQFLRLSNHFNVQYNGRFTIGDQELPMIYDTGSFEVPASLELDLWQVLVLSTKCRSCVKSLSMWLPCCFP